jgi:hypothetical protein
MFCCRVVELVRVPGVIVRVPDEHTFQSPDVSFSLNLSAVRDIGNASKGLKVIQNAIGTCIGTVPSAERVYRKLRSLNFGECTVSVIQKAYSP